MGPHRGSWAVTWLCAVVVLALALVPTAGAVPAGVPGVPSIPGIPHGPTLPKPDAKAVFDVTVEGEATDTNDSQLSGTQGECLVTESGHVVEKDTYLRGKGVRIEFARYGHTIVVKRNRGGQIGDTSLAVQVTVRRTASGGATFSPRPKMQCSIPPTDLSKNKDCGRPINFPGTAVLLGWDSGRVSLGLTNGSQLKAGSSPDSCGDDDVTGVSDQVYWAWPNPVKLSTAALPVSQIFGRQKAFTKFLTSNEAGLTPHDVQAHLGDLAGDVTDHGHNSATIRFTRVKG